MKTAHLVLLGAGAVGVGYLLFRPKSAYAGAGYLPAVNVQQTASGLEAVQAAVLRSFVGAKAASGASAGMGSVVASAVSQTNAKAAGVLGGAADKILPGSGGIVGGLAKSAGSVTTSVVGNLGTKAVKGIKSLFSW